MNPETVGMVLALLALLWGVTAATIGWANEFKLRRAEYIRVYTNDFYASSAMQRLFLDIDNERFTFTEQDYGTQKEVELAQLLDYFNAIGMSLHQRLLKRKDLRRTTVGYAALTTWRDRHVQAFIARIDGNDATQANGTLAFWYFRRMGERLADPRVQWYQRRDH